MNLPECILYQLDRDISGTCTYMYDRMIITFDDLFRYHVINCYSEMGPGNLLKISTPHEMDSFQ